MKNYSLWLDGIKNKNYSTLDKDLNVDVLIIGGGITGVSTAYHLRNSKKKICIVDRDQIASAVSSKTTGKLTYLQEDIYIKLEKNYSFEVAKSYYESQKDAIKLVEGIIKKNNIECNYTKQTSYLFANRENEILKLKQEQKLLENMGVKIKVNEKLPIEITSNYTISVSDTAYFHPVKYIKELANICYQNNIDIYENTKVINLRKENNLYICSTDKNKIIAKKVILACHYPFFLFPYFFPLKGSLERSYISAFKVSKNLDVSGINLAQDTKSFRFHQDYLNNYFLYLTGSHNLAFKFDITRNFEELYKDLNAKPEYIWSNIDIITNDYLPYIGYIDDNLLIGTGYNTWGMTNGSLAGKILSDLILNKKNKYSDLFNPKRSMPITNIFSISKDLFSSAKPFIENKLIKNKSFYTDRVLFTKKDGKNIAIYIDSNKKEHIVYNKCPHMKCSLIFNEVEKTWDCPCHASRFDIDGNVIEGPSCYNIGYKRDE